MNKNKAEKALRWVVNTIPDFEPKTNEEKMLLAIKLYSEAGAEEIKRLEAENAALRERLGKWAVDNEIVMESRVKDGQTYYVISRKERRIITHYICTELTPEAAETRIKELQGEEK